MPSMTLQSTIVNGVEKFQESQYGNQSEEGSTSCQVGLVHWCQGCLGSSRSLQCSDEFRSHTIHHTALLLLHIRIEAASN